MTDTIQILIDSQPAEAALQTLGHKASDMSGLMQRIARHLADVAEESFATETSPDGIAWANLSPRTIARRKRRGHWPGPKLQVQGLLARSITTEHGKDYAQIGSNVPYARIQQKGGKTGRGYAATITARPFLGLSAEAEENIADEVSRWFAIASHRVELAKG